MERKNGCADENADDGGHKRKNRTQSRKRNQRMLLSLIL